MDWTYNGEPISQIPEGYIGFVYLITNLTNNKKYIGKKLAQFRKSRPPLKGKKNRRKYTVESDWKDYWGSSDRLNEDVTNLGTEKFTREILYFCKSKAELSYLELFEQVKRNVLASDEYYNGIINVRISSSEALKKLLTEMQNNNDLF